MLRNVSGLIRVTSINRGCILSAAMRAKRRIEPLDMAHLHADALAVCQIDDLLSRAGIRGQRLFDQTGDLALSSAFNAIGKWKAVGTAIITAAAWESSSSRSAKYLVLN